MLDRSDIFIRSNRIIIVFLISIIFMFCFYSNTYAATVDVSINNFFFQPQNLTINAGDTVKWTNFGGSHTTTSGASCTADGQWNSGILSIGQSYTATFNSVGTYPYFCMLHCSSGMVGSVTVTAASLMQAPTGQQNFIYASTETTTTNIDPAQARPISVGSVATGGNTVTIHINTLQFSRAVDVYFGIFAPAIDPNNIYLLDQAGSLQLLAKGLVAWKTNISTPVAEALFGNIPKALLPSGTYFLYLLVTPEGSLNNYYLWQTSFFI